MGKNEQLSMEKFRIYLQMKDDKKAFQEIESLVQEYPIFEVVNDGEVTALAGAMGTNDNAVLGVAMGTSEAAGYVPAYSKLFNFTTDTLPSWNTSFSPPLSI